MRKLSVCIIGCVSSELRGPQRFVFEFSKWLSHRSIKGILICGALKKLVKSIDISNLSTTASEVEESALIKHLPSLIHSLLFSFFSFLKIIQLNKRYRFSIIHAQDANYGAVAAVTAAKLLHIPVVLEIHGINTDIIHLRIRPKWLATLYRAYYLFLQKESIKRSDCVICVSKDTKRCLPMGEKIVIPMGVDTASFQSNQNLGDIREDLGIPQHVFMLGYVGALSAEKGLHTLLKSFCYMLREIPKEESTYLLIVGDGPEKRNLEDLACELDVRRYLRLPGFRTEVSRLLDTMDVFVFPSKSEGSPIAILEAMGAGKAIIASDIPGIREIVRHGKEAILVDPHNVDELKRAMLLLRKDRDLRARLGHKAKKRAKLYDVEEVYGRILKVYERLICRKNGIYTGIRK